MTAPSHPILARFLVKFTDDNDGDSNYFADANGRVYLRVMGIVRTHHGEYSGQTAPRNSVALLEALLLRDKKVDLKSPFSLAGAAIGAEISGNSFDIVLVVGAGEFIDSGGNKDIYGGAFVANVSWNASSSSYQFGTTSFTFNGNSNIYYDSRNIENSITYLPLRLLSWRRVRPELDV